MALMHSKAAFHHDESDTFRFTPDAFSPAHDTFQLAATPVFPDSTTLATSPTSAQEVAFISGIDSTGKIVSKSFWTWNNNDPATFAGTSNVHKWGSATTGTPGGTVKYYFDTGSHWTSGEKAVFTACLTLWSDLANISFVQTSSKSAAQITLKRGDDGQAVTPASWSGTSGAGHVGGTHAWQTTGATVSIDTSVQSFGPVDGLFTTAGGHVWETILHEEGHALGLGHGGAYNGSVDATTQQFSAYDTQLWSIMSYIDPTEAAKYSSQYPVKGTNWGSSPDHFSNGPTTPMSLDIQAIQAIYGASTAAAYSGGQTFGFHCNIADATKEFYDFTADVNPVVTIWDSGAHNTLDLSGYSASSTINLNPGTFSSCNGQKNNICIASDTKVDTAIGGSGNDKITGNSSANTLTGNGGKDTLDGAAGADKMNGGSGSDIFVYAKAGESTGSHFDAISGFDATADTMNLWFTVSGTLKTLTHGNLSAATFDADLAHDVPASKLAVHHFLLFTPSGGDEAGKTFLIVDANGTAGYQAGQDLVIELSGAAHLSSLSAHDFT